MKKILLGILTVVAVVFNSGFATAEVSKPEMDGKNRAPEFSLTDTNGKTIKLSDYAGKIVVLEWTNPDCPFVKRHYKSATMKKTADKYATQGVVWLALSSTHFHDDARLKEWITEKGITYPVLNDKTGVVGKLYGAQTTPHMFIIDVKGNIAYSGAIDSDPTGESENSINYVDQALTELLSAKPISMATTKPYGCSVKYG